jgi:KDO2-lipid IV(A) lauroyltransferase
MPMSPPTPPSRLWSNSRVATATSKATRFHTGLLAPRCWPTWLGIGCWWLLVQLPYPLLLLLGRAIGLLIFAIPTARRHITLRNLQLCFPELDERARHRLARANFVSLGIALFETGIAWWWPRWRFMRLIEVQGLEQLQAVQGRGVMLLGAHFTTLEIGGAAIAASHSMDGMYRAHKNPVLDFVQARGRVSKSRNQTVVYERKDVRGTMKALKAGRTLWYGPDQDYGLRQGLFAPFFGQQAATVYATARFAEKTGAAVVPFCHYRKPWGRGYRLIVGEPLEAFPSGDDLADASRINRVLEEMIRVAPEQYLWAHKRFKNRPPGEPDVYTDAA